MRAGEKVLFLILISFVLSPNTWASKILKVERERKRIEKSEQSLKDSEDLQKKKYKDQLELLRVHEERQKERKEGIEENSRIKIREDFEVKLFNYLEFFKYKLNFNISLPSLYDFIEEIEKSKKNWKEEAHSLGRVVKHNLYLDYVDGFKKKVRVDCDTSGRIFLDFKWEKPLQGGFKYIQRVLNYETLKSASKIRPIFKEPKVEVQREIQRVFESEGEVLKDLMKVSKEKQTGLIKTYSVTSSIVFQKYMASDLFDLIASPPQEPKLFSTEVRTEIIKQLALGLVSLHHKKIVHNDVKPENILVDLQRKEGVKAVFIDYGLSLRENSKEFEAEERPFEGTPFYLPPEIEKHKWIGNTPHERMVSGFKSDVFGLTTVAMLVFNLQGLSVPWSGVCKELDFGCKALRIYDFQRMIAKQHSYSRLSQLFIAGLSYDVSKRISADQFLYGIEYIQKREKVANSYDFLENKSELLKLYHNWKHFADITHKEAEKRLTTAQKGNYYLVPFEVASERTALALCFKDRIGITQTKVLDLDPKDKSAVADEIKFLQMMQTLVTD